MITWAVKWRVPLLIAAFILVAAVLGGHLVGVASVAITANSEECPRIDVAHGILGLAVNKSSDRGARACPKSENLSADQQRVHDRLFNDLACKGCQLQRFNFDDERLTADLQGADLTGASLCGTRLRSSHFEKAILVGAYLIQAGLTGVHMDGALLMGAHLERSELVGTHLKDTQMRGAHLDNAQFEPADIPTGDRMIGVTGLRSLCYIKSPTALHELRDAFKKAGMQTQEREVTYAIKRSDRLHAAGALDRLLPYIFSEALTEWGLAPLRPVIVLFGLIPVFAILYAIAIAASAPNAAIWRVWDKNRPDKQIGQDEPERLTSENSAIYYYALAFSLFSAFALGWKGVSVSTWIEGLLPHEFTLKATGWPRIVAGAQSLLTAFLLAMTASPLWVQ